MHRAALLLTLAALTCGCMRAHYRRRADADTYHILREQTYCAPWETGQFSINVDPSSRLANHGPVDDPCLPLAAPSLYDYDLPRVPDRDPRRFSTSLFRGDGEIPVESDVDRHGQYDIRRFPPRTDSDAMPPALSAPAVTPVRQVAFTQVTPDTAAPQSTRPPDSLDAATLDEPTIVPIERDAWNAIPANCLIRAMEFRSVIQEYELSYGQAPAPQMFDTSEKLALEDLLALGLLNSREYQTQKELLYRVALRLTLERYDYQLKFSPTGNGIDADYTHRNLGGITENTLAAPSSLSMEKLLATGGNFLAQFANNVILTFNGPNGFAADVSSELFAEFTQALLQRDIVFENLTQAERDVVYAARDFARFRKLFFQQIASDYYRLLLTYRNIEINMLDFFSNQRGYQQGRYEYELRESVPLFQVDQFEQTVLQSRSRVISSCNQFERSLDELKLRLGIPPETSMNLDLRELDTITARDEITVAAEMASRAYRNLSSEAGKANRRQLQPINAAIRLAQRILAQLDLETSQNISDHAELRPAMTDLLKKLQAEDAAIGAREVQDTLERAMKAPRPPATTKLFYLRMNLVQSLIQLGVRQLAAYEETPFTRDTLLTLQVRWNDLNEGLDAISRELAESDSEDTDNAEVVATKNRLLEGIRKLADEAETLLDDAQATVGINERLDASRLIEDVIRLGDRLRQQNVGGLSPVVLPIDEAMLTALVTRFDLMNERGALADTWRQIKLTGDDLRSVLNLSASHSLRTRSSVNRPFDFNFDDSTTRATISFDAPLNRRAQRNRYRSALINYQQGLRNLVELEDEIKFGIRNDLRNLQLDREQYSIAVTSAALANDRVISTRTQLQRNLGDITARDFLEAQRAYTLSLNSVASEHISYILDRIALFLDLELLTVDDQGFWPELYNDAYQPEMRHQPPAGSGPAYGRLPRGLHYSTSIRRMDCVPFGQPSIFQPQKPEAPTGPIMPPPEELPVPIDEGGTSSASEQELIGPPPPPAGSMDTPQVRRATAE